MTLRVLHIGKYFPPTMGGMEVFLHDLLLEQRRQGIDAHAVVHGDPLPDDAPWITRVPVQLKLAYAPIALGFRRALSRAIARIQPDVLHLHMPNNSALWLLTLPCARKLPWVVHWQSDVVATNPSIGLRLAYATYQPFEQAVLQHAQCIIATSPPYLQSSQALQTWRDKCHVVPLGMQLNAPEVTTDPAPHGRWRTDTQFRLLSIGRLTYYKGFETLIRAVAGLPGAELLIVGEGEERPQLEALIQAVTPAGTPAATRLVGSVSDAEKHALLEQCDVFCLASRERTEAFGVVLLEAMLHRRPCVVTDLAGSGMPWVATYSGVGLLAAQEDIPAWQAALQRLQDQPRLREQLGQAGFQSVHHTFNITTCERQLALHYARITGKPTPAHIPPPLHPHSAAM